MYIVFVDDTPDDHERVASCVPIGRFERIEPCTTSEELDALLAEIVAHRKQEPALVLLDMAIGEDDQCGLSMLKRVRDCIPHMPVIMVSQSRMKPLIVESFRGGACSYIQKSVAPGPFKERITDMLKYWLATSKMPATADTYE